MTTQASNFTGNIPELYDENLGPRIFLPYARDMARRVVETAPEDVLEIAAGTGILSREIKDALPQGSHLTISDLNPPMLEVARTKFKAQEHVEIRQADATALPFADATFDVVCCQFGVMFFPDKPQAYREAHRVLREGGRYLFSVWGPFEENAFGRIAQETIAGFFDADPPTFYRTPFGYHDVDAIEASLADAGFHRVASHRVRRDVDVPDTAHFARGLVLGNPVAEEIRTRTSADTEAVIATLTVALQNAFGRDPGRMTLNAIILQADKD